MRALGILFLLLASGLINAQAAEIEQFFMPGELISGHQQLESECKNCHVRLRDTTQDQLCLDCHDHETVAQDIREKQGFHGKDKNASRQPCKTCHGDHKGRDVSIVSIDQDNFDHRNTDYALSGRHRLVECGSCHQPDKKYREAQSGCYDCHSEDDAHRGELGKQCRDCHVSSGWASSEFDHDQTDFKLKFSHQKVTCNACHLKGTYKQTPQRCVDCHALRDVHANRFGNRCESCHQERAWDKSKFDHDRDTDYPLEGKHRGQSCNACHAIGYRAPEKKGRIRSCYSCHREDDSHNGSNGNKCQDCHVVRDWRQAEFDHDTNTEFALNGAHRDLVCDACHVFGAKSKKIDTDCYSCHRQDDAHNQDLGKTCNQCHGEVSWLGKVRYDHDLGSFPLIGQHAVTGCEACHQTSVFSDSGQRCNDCHRADDIHRQALGTECAQCHNPNDWLIWSFDHDETSFQLRQAHAELHCHSCHDKFVPQSSAREWRCADCHRRDDIHDGKFGASCDNCHDQKNFERVNIRSTITQINRQPQQGVE